MKLKSIKIKDFKRFASLEVKNLPETARLIVLLGPNGSGKSSLFDAFNSHLKRTRFFGVSSKQMSYFDRQSINRAENERLDLQQRVGLEFHDDGPTNDEGYKKSLYVRSAYRHDPSFHDATISKPPDVLEEYQLPRLSEDDKTVATNFQRLIWQFLRKASVPGSTTDKVIEDTIGTLQSSLLGLFGDLTLNALVSQDEHGTFTFSKGAVSNFLYENLSGGEKAAFDLILDVFVKKSVYDDSLYCIDEPEIHLNTRLQGQVLEELYNLIPDNSQLWIATHSIGMVRKAEELRAANSSEIVFLDFGFRPNGERRDFDQHEVIAPSATDRLFWSRHYDVALDDLSKLLAPQNVVLCEGGEEAGADGFDAACYNKIFAAEHPHTLFLSVGSANDVEKRVADLLPLIGQIIEGTEIVRLRDRDDLTPQEIADKKQKGVRSLTQFRNLESLLLSDEILCKLCRDHRMPEHFETLISKRNEILEKEVAEGKPNDDLKPTAQAVHHASKQLLNISQSGGIKEVFMRDILAPLVTPETKVYRSLHDDIFG